MQILKPSADIVILRHPREKKSKCSLQPLVGRPDIEFFDAYSGTKVDATGYIVLTLDAPVLTKDDAPFGILLLDSTWRLLPDVMACVAGKPVYRSLPGEISTAYPRKSKISSDPMHGLASVEALYLSMRIMGRDTSGILDDYYWKDAFLASVTRSWPLR